ncbi:MAG: ABC transporter ATP-binding protein [bacterium]|nr:ABC transporter ATP-binding protein [bacterium]
MITTKGLHIGYKQQKLIKVEDLQLSAGVYILIGKNGSGKSTFLKTLTGTIPAVSGKIELNGTSIHALSESERPKHIAFVSTQFPVVDFLKVSEYLALGRSPHTAFFGKLQPRDKEMVQNALRTLDIEHLSERFTNELSDGERQMVVIARTFAQGTDIIALDEPTAFLDYQNKSEIVEKLMELGQSHGKFIILSSHDLDQSIASGADFLIVDRKEKTLSHAPAGTSKQNIIERAFS